LKYFKSLSFRVLGGTFILLVGLATLSTYLIIKFHRDQTMEFVYQNANSLSDVIKNSTHYSMLLNRNEDVYQIITMVGKEPGVEGIRIYNKRGEIMYSTIKAEEKTVVDMHTEACYGCHNQEEPLSSLPISNRRRVYTSPQGYRVLGVINPIRNEKSCSDNECHAHSPDKTVLGVLDVRMSLEHVDEAIANAQGKITASAGIAILALLFTSLLFLYRTVHKPVRKLIEGTKEISSGNLSHMIPIRSSDELGLLAESFNSMTTYLRSVLDENQRWSQELEKRVKDKTEELKQIHEQILQIEKMASLGKLSATVAHELNNPLEGILTYAKLISKQLRKNTNGDVTKEPLEELDLIIRETERCGNIVKNLLLFSKKQAGEFALVHLKEIINKSVQLVQHHFHISNIQFQEIYEDEDILILCDANQIEQALIALFVNSAEAMPEGGTMKIEVFSDAAAEQCFLKLTDTGCGIPAEDIPHIFEPFYSTKKEGKGVGLGLSVVYGIIERHSGKITVSSTIGKGTEFSIMFPSSSQSKRNKNTWSPRG
jgi:two-component system, NtrC family, sensor kinase